MKLSEIIYEMEKEYDVAKHNKYWQKIEIIEYYLPLLKALNDEDWKPEVINGYTQIAVDRRTLPKDGQYIRFKTENEDEHDGYFIEGSQDDIFHVSESLWFFKWHVHQWKSI